MSELESVLNATGPRLKTLRQGQNLTLADVEAETGISASTLSRLESGQRRASLELLIPLARIYGVTLDELVDTRPRRDPRVRQRPIKRDGMTMVPLTRRGGAIQAYKIIMTRQNEEHRQPRVHDGYEWLYVLSGRLRMILGDQDLVLEPGEAAEFDTRIPHWFGPESDGQVEFLSLFGAQGERAHVRIQTSLKSETE